MTPPWWLNQDLSLCGWLKEFKCKKLTKTTKTQLTEQCDNISLIITLDKTLRGLINKVTPLENRILPWIWVLGEGRQAARVHVSPDIDVHRCVRFGQLCRQRDPLSGQRRDRGPGQRQPWHASSLLKTSVEESHGNDDKGGKKGKQQQ